MLLRSTEADGRVDVGGWGGGLLVGVAGGVGFLVGDVGIDDDE